MSGVVTGTLPLHLDQSQLGHKLRISSNMMFFAGSKHVEIDIHFPHFVKMCHVGGSYVGWMEDIGPPKTNHFFLHISTRKCHKRTLHRTHEYKWLQTLEKD